MSKDFDDIIKKIDQSDKSLFRDITNLEKDHDKILKEISDVKKQVKDISFKVDMMLEILNNFTIMLAEDEENLEDNYDSDETWVPKDEDFWEDDSDESL
jgi:regulator of replication initiation timing